MMPLLLLVCALLAFPVVVLFGAWVGVDASTWATWTHLLDTVLPAYVSTSLVLAVSVGLGVAVVGSTTAAAVTLFEFPGRRFLEAALLLPLAMPAYVLAYAYTDTLQYSGPLQSALRGWTGLRGPLWPDVRSLGGAIPLFIICLYPYVYLLTRSALSERGIHLMEAARLLGASLPRRILRVALPMARPAIMAGTALALMETMADYGVSGFFGLTTFTTGIYKAWLSLGDRDAAAQLATVLLLAVGSLVVAEQMAQRRLRYATARPGAGHAHDARPIDLGPLGRVLAWAVCGLPVLAGFVIPVVALLRLMWIGSDSGDGDGGLPWLRFLGWCWNSFALAGFAAALAAALSLALAFARRTRPSRLLALLSRLVGLGYAVPGAVIVVGILLPIGALQRWWPASPLGLLVTTTVAGLIYAYLVRFTAVALQAVEAGYARVPASLDESARMLGIGAGALWRQVHWPLMRRATWTAVLLVFVDVMKELPATLVLRPFDRDTLAVMANQLARDERLAEAAWPSLAIVAVGLLPVWLLARASVKPPPSTQKRPGEPAQGAFN